MATAVGFIALAGVAAEFGVVMLVYLENAWKRRLAGEPDDEATLLEAIREGAVLRVRPKAMTVAIVLAGLIPMMWGQGTGSEIMARIAAPMVGGMVTAPLLSMLVVPAAWWLLQRRRFARRPQKLSGADDEGGAGNLGAGRPAPIARHARGRPSWRLRAGRGCGRAPWPPGRPAAERKHGRRPTSSVLTSTRMATSRPAHAFNVAKARPRRRLQTWESEQRRG